MQGLRKSGKESKKKGGGKRKRPEEKKSRRKRSSNNSRSIKIRRPCCLRIPTRRIVSAELKKRSGEPILSLEGKRSHQREDMRVKAKSPRRNPKKSHQSLHLNPTTRRSRKRKSRGKDEQKKMKRFASQGKK